MRLQFYYYYLLNVLKCVRFSSSPYTHVYYTHHNENSQLHTFHQYNSNPNSTCYFHQKSLFLSMRSVNLLASNCEGRISKIETTKQEKQQKKTMWRKSEWKTILANELFTSVKLHTFSLSLFLSLHFLAQTQARIRSPIARVIVFVRCANDAYKHLFIKWNSSKFLFCCFIRGGAHMKWNQTDFASRFLLAALFAATTSTAAAAAFGIEFNQWTQHTH